MTKQVAGNLKGELAQFRELAAFAQFGSDLDARTKAQLDRGSRIVELFKQPAFNPLPIEMQAAVLWAMQNNYFDAVDVKKIVDAANHLKEFLNTRKSALLDTLRQKAVVDDTITAELKKALEEWKSTYASS
jgi:F-type H+-transporting ATPase subunit alpha